MRYCGINDIDAVDRTTLREFALLMKAAKLKELDNMRDLHVQAWLNNAAKATEKRNKKVVAKFKTFKSFFDYEKLEAEILGNKKHIDEQQKDFLGIVAKANSSKRNKK